MYDTANIFADGFVWAVHTMVMPLIWLFVVILIFGEARIKIKLIILGLLLALLTVLSGAVRHVAYIPERMRVEAMMPEITQRALEQRRLLDEAAARRLKEETR